MIVFFNDRYIPLEDVAISPFDRGFLFADGVYESIRTYNRRLFKYDEHLTRLKRSLNELKINYKNVEHLEGAIYKLIELNDLHKTQALVYLQITRGKQFPRKHNFSQAEPDPTIFISANKFTSDLKEQKEGIKIILHEDLRWLRCDIKSTSLLPVILANQKAAEARAKEAILIRDEMVTEGTHTNFFAIKNKQVFTAPLSNLILEGVTRKVVMAICKELLVPVNEEHIKKSELKTYDEFFITSTTKEITPVVQIDEHKIGNGDPGNVTKKLQTALYRITKEYK